MKQINSTLLFVILAATALILSGLTLVKGGLYLGKHESDILHLLDILQRLKLGAQIHIDFQTPIGVLAFSPILWLSQFGFDLGQSFAGAQALLAILLLPTLWWVGVSRLGSVGAVFFGISVLAIATAMVDGQVDTSSSISVHYNRWAWTIAFSALALSVLKSRYSSKLSMVFEGVMIGLFMAILALLKVTYFAGFAVPVVAGLLVHKSHRVLGLSVFTGLVVVAITTAMMGPDFWRAYLTDLIQVTASPNRPYPGASFSELVASLQFIGISVIAFAACVTLRHAGQSKEALLLLLCMPGFYYVTFQNYGNDPIWLIFLIVFLMANRPERDLRNGLGWELRGSAGIIAGAALATLSPIYLNILTSSLHHYAVNPENYAPFIPSVSKDIHTADIRSKSVTTLVNQESGLEAYTIAARNAPLSIGGLELPDCQLKNGAVTTVHAMSAGIAKILPAQGGSLYVADVNSAHWIKSGMVPAKGAAPWYYGGLPGFENAGFLLVPKCPAVLGVRNSIIELANKRPNTLFTKLDETVLYAFFRIDPLGVEESSQNEVESQ